MADLKKTNAPGYFVNEQGVIINGDELAWMKYKAEREMAMSVVRLIEQVDEMRLKILELERKLDEATSVN